MKYLHLYLFLLITLLSSSVAQAQNIDKIKDEKSQIEQEIAQTNKLLSQNSKEQQSSLEEWQKLSSTIEVRKKMIQDLDKEMKGISFLIQKTQKRIDSLDNRFNLVQSEVSNLLRKQYIQSVTISPQLILLSATGINQLLMRWRYFSQVNKHRKTLFDEMKVVKEKLNVEKKNLLAQQSKLLKMKVLRESQLDVLKNDQAKNENILKTLKKNKASLTKKLKAQEAERRDLNRKLEEMLRKERGNSSSKEVSLISGNFAQNKGRMPWPVENSKLNRGFGSFAHPFERGITIKNDGVDLQCDAKASVRAIFEGEVIATIAMPGYANVVMIKHGDYSTIYSKLDQVYIKKGDKVAVGDEIGEVKPKDGSTGEFHFEIWHLMTPLNPLDWLR